jgi:hypothetical protein
MPYLEKRPDGYRIRWRDGGRGSKIHSSPTFSTKLEAQTYQRTLTQKQAAAKPVKDPCRAIPLSELIERYFLARTSKTNDPAARKRYDAEYRQRLVLLLQQFPSWRYASDITPHDLQQLPIGRRRYARILVRLAASLGQQLCPGILHLRLPGKKHRPTPDLLTTDQISAVIASAEEIGPTASLVVHLLSTYGHRPETIAALSQENYNPSDQTLTLAIKGGDIHRHPILKITADKIATAQKWLSKILGRPLRPTDPLCPCPNPRPPTQRWPHGRAIGHWYRRTIGAKIHPESDGIYQLKRYAITNMIAVLKLDPKTVASITGHRTVSLLLQNYSSTNLDRQKSALSALQNSLVLPGAPKP